MTQLISCAGKSDPYCVLSLSASPSNPFLTTSVKKETLYPVMT